MMAVKPLLLEGRAWPITDANGVLIPDIDTDQIYHNAHLAVTDVKEMAQYAFGNLEGWKDFPAKVKAGDILVVGPNFGAGSSRQHAVDCFLALGVAAVLGTSFGPIYKRNAINAGWALVECPALADLKIAGGDVVRVDLENAEVTNVSKNIKAPAKPFSRVQLDIYLAGDLFAYGATL